MTERELSIEYLASVLHTPIAEAESLLLGGASINADRAAKLSASFGASARFWLTREAEYIEDRMRVMAADWSRSLPLQQMQNFGWIHGLSDWRQEINECLRFFGVSDFEEWQDKYSAQVASAHYRKSAAFDNNENATLVWFRAGERELESLERNGEFDASELRSRIPLLRRLTRISDPTQFIPQLQQTCAEAGLAVVVVRAPEGCRASGATRWLGGSPVVQLSARHLSDDHLWFTFFHELGHVLCHGETDRAFIDLDVESMNPDTLEDEADGFATRAILGESNQDEHQGATHYREVIKEATRIGVSPGLLAGQLQHRGIVPRDRLNRLKRRYRWDGTTLKTK